MKALAGGVALAVAVALALPLLLVGALSPAGAGIGSSAPSAVALAEIPPFLLARYQASPVCAGLPWQVVAAVGWVESRHGGGRVDLASGHTAPAILGPALDGSAGTMAIPATRASATYTGDPVWDHAVGPMQFLTSTFRAWAVHVSAEATASPNNAFDAIATAGRFLCGGASRVDSIEAAVRRYNNSAPYVAEVVAKALAYGMAPAGGSPDVGGAAPTTGLVVGADLARVIGFALAQLGKPYVWGAVGPDSWDCSGLTQASYAAAGIAIGRTTWQQALAGVAVDWRSGPIAAGDLVFIRSADGASLGHVGLALDAVHWIVAPYTGTVVQIAPIPLGAVQAVRRIAA